MLAPDGVTPARFFTHYFNSSQVMREYAAERGVPAGSGSTTLEVEGGIATAPTSVEGRPVIRTVARVGDAADVVLAGHLRYVTRVENRLIAGNYPYIGELVSTFEVQSIEFLDDQHPVYALRPASPLQVVTGSSFDAPRDSLVYPGREEDIGPAEGGGHGPPQEPADS